MLGTAESQGLDPIIANYSHTPINPFPGVEIIVLATLNILPQGFDNITIIFSINDQNETRAMMQSLGGTQFQYVFQGQDNGSVIKYWLELYVQGSLEDRKPTSGYEQIQIIDPSAVPINISYGRPIDLPTGNFSLISEEGNFRLNLTLSGAISITITRQPLAEVVAPVNFLAVSDKFIIEVNSTEPIKKGTIKITYSQNEIDRVNADENRIKLLKIDDGNTEQVDGIIDPSANTITANTTSFSEWIVSVEKPNLKIRDISVPEIAKQEQPFSLKFVLTNLGNSKATNVTLLVFLPSGLNMVNNSSRFQISELSPLQNITFSLNLLAEQIGNYTIVITVEAQGGIQESEPITLLVGNEIRSNNEKTNAPFIYTPVTAFLIRRKQESHKRNY
ncbi:MAG: hypothetical protein D6732_02290 [Methanobacteriota archaeon]|nr:MAG: hypothetical protein D6732_02290 [Euryarchaeota archaeon]